jgi:hypothetical protein
MPRRHLPPAIVEEIELRPSSYERSTLHELLEAFDWACDEVYKIARKANTRHQAALHALAYRAISPAKTHLKGVPSAYATRAIARVSLRLRNESQGLPDPFPPHSIDLDPKTLDLDTVAGVARITTLDARGRRGGAALGTRLEVPMALSPAQKRLIRAVGPIRTATLVFWKGEIGRKPLTLIVRLSPAPTPETHDSRR